MMMIINRNALVLVQRSKVDYKVHLLPDLPCDDVKRLNKI